MFDKSKQELEAAQKRLASTKYILIFALIFFPICLFFNIKIALFGAAILIALWGVSTYIAFMHCFTIKNRIKSKK